ncbi:NnrU family protein [Allorhizobium taibaishanense]|uniref:NnrU family protein n=1 Tax=Allorhizobium taibaishanense TaxID=887144 RepID=A0A1Q9A9J8_9HYPH|nr:NnrU family protein [Allorhizobium taibaishanense]MBB4009941.1 putative membrane protein [Allorhizobium taibaishanense]OLP51563.1 NnrU family protein [Allorhizobium taibaishanense]
MVDLFLAFFCFLALHSLPALPAVKQRLIGLIGRPVYMALYSLLSLATLVWVFYAFMEADDVALWLDRAWQAWITLALAPIGLFLVICGLSSPNPASITFRKNQQPGAIVALTRHPVLWGFFLWAFGHIFPNGELRGVVLFGGFAIFSLVGIIILERRSSRKLGTAWNDFAGKTSIVPFAAFVAGRTRLGVDRDMVFALAITVIGTFALLFAFHEVLFGVDPLLLALYGV